jgi:trigger factor
MKITREQTGVNTETIQVTIEPDDYKDQVSKVLKDYQKNTKISGFRPGKVPFGMINKLYGKSVLADEINKVLSESLGKYLEEEKLDILGNPLPNMEKQKPLNFEENETFDFFFDIGLVPEVDFVLDENFKIDQYNIKPDDEMIDNFIKSEQRKFGEHTHPEKAADDDLLLLSVQPLDENGNPTEKEGPKNAHINLETVTDDKVKDRLHNLKLNEQTTIQPEEFFGSLEEASKKLTTTQDQIKAHPKGYAITLTEITHIVPAKLDKELFDKMYPGEDLKTQKAFKERIAKDMEMSFAGESDKLLLQDVQEKLLDTTEISLPDDFMKRWLAEHEENKLTPEEIEVQYPPFSRSMKWQFIQNKILKENKIEVTEEEVRDFIKTHVLRQANLNPDDPAMAQQFESIVDTLMQNKEQVDKIVDQLTADKLMKALKEKITLKPKDVSYTEFIKIATEKQTETKK